MLNRAISAEKTSALERTQTKKKIFRRGRCASSVSKSHTAEFGPSHDIGSFAVSPILQGNSRLSAALQDRDYDFRKFLLTNLLFSALKPEEHKAKFFYLTEADRFLREPALVFEAHHDVKESTVEDWNELSFWRTATSMYRHEPSAALSGKKPSEAAQQYAVLAGSRNLLELQRRLFSSRTTLAVCVNSHRASSPSLSAQLLPRTKRFEQNET